MSNDDKSQRKSPLKLDTDQSSQKGAMDTYEELESAGKKGSVFQRLNNAFQEALQTSRGTDRPRETAIE